MNRVVPVWTTDIVPDQLRLMPRDGKADGC